MRSASGPPARAIASRARPNVSCVDAAETPGSRRRDRLRHRQGRRARAPRYPLVERDPGEKTPSIRLRDVQPREPLPFLPRRHAVRCAHRLDLLRAHQPRVVVLVSGEGKSVALDGVGEEAGRPLVGDVCERLEHALDVVPSEIGHQRPELVVVVLRDERPHTLARADVAEQVLAPRGPSLHYQRRVQGVRACVDPLAERLAPRAPERLAQLRAVLDGDDIPSHAREQAVEAAEQPVADHRVEALAVVVDDPPQIAHIVFPAFRGALRRRCPRRAPRHRRSPPSVRGVRPERATGARRDSPGPVPRTSSSQPRARPTRWRYPRRRCPWCGTDRTAHRRTRGTVPASPVSGGPADTGWRGTPGSRAASPRSGPRAVAHRGRARSSGSRPTRSSPGGRRPSTRRRSAGRGWRGGSSRWRARGFGARAPRSIVTRSGPAIRGGAS